MQLFRKINETQVVALGVSLKPKVKKHVILALDDSGSMENTDGGYKTRWD